VATTGAALHGFCQNSDEDFLTNKVVPMTGLPAPKYLPSAISERLRPRRRSQAPVLVQEQSGIHVGISADLPQAARHAADTLSARYRQWRDRERLAAWGRYKRQHFCIAVGGGNTIKSQYKALVETHHADIDWIRHVRFFFLEASSGESGWESAENSLVINLLMPLARKLIGSRGLNPLADQLGLELPVDENDVIDRMIALMVHPVNLVAVKRALDQDNRALASRRAREEAQRYQREIETRLGGTMAFHLIVSGIGKNGTLGAFSPYTPELADKVPGVTVLRQESGAIRVALNRGVMINAECISLIVAGSLKLRALGRFEMEESADFEQTVMETPLRMLRETRDTAEKVYIFADEDALHFDTTLFEYSDRGILMQNKAETRDGEEAGGIHILLMHGFMGLFSFTSFLIRLPSAWTVSALHRGSHAKTLPDDEIFPHYARVLRKAMLKLWRQGRPVPIASHSIAGVIIDHLLLSIIGGPGRDVPPYEDLSVENRQLVDALRAGGIVNLATWAPTDGPHAGQNIKSLINHYRDNGTLDYSGFDQTYESANGNTLRPTQQAAVTDDDSLAGLGRFLNRRTARPLVNGLNLLIRMALNNRTVQQRMLNTDSPYVLRLVGGRLLKTASIYGLCKEVNAALHSPPEYQQRHLQALDIIVAYDIPYLSIVHEDDFLVSARRHREEQEYLVKCRKQKEGVKRKDDLAVTVRYIALQRERQDLPVDPLNPHLLIMSTSTEGNTMARQITAAMTRFVNENVAKAMASGQVKPLPSVRQWMRKHGLSSSRRKKKVA
jgi:6-phosphogluconolactonase/glucosamine-6-phosphate isomerase/deaminase